MLKVKRAAAHKMRHGDHGREAVLKLILSAAIGFISSFGKLIGFPSYINVACAALSGAYIIPSFLGSCIQYALFGSFESGIVQLCSILCIAALRAVNPFGERREDPMFLSVTTTGSLMLFSCVMTAAAPTDAATASLRMISSLMCGCTVYAARTVMQRKRTNGVFDLTGMNGVMAGIFYVTVVSTLTSIPAFAINLGRVFGVFVLFQAVKRYGNIGGAVVGALTTCGVLLCDPSLARNTLLLATSGLICGAFVSLGTLLTVLVFLGTSLLSLVAVGVNADTFQMFADLAAGSMLFVVVPMPFINRILKNISGYRNSLELIGQTTSSKLSFAGEALGGIRHQLTMVTAAMDKKTALRSVAADVKNCVCGECDNYAICYGKSERTDIGLSQLEKITEKYSGICEEDVRKCLKCCVKPSLMCRAFGEFHENLVSERADNMRMREMREFLTEQLSSMEDILDDLSFRTSQVRSIDPNLSARVRDYFNNLGYPNAKVCVYTDENLCMRADVFLTAEFVGDPVKITAAVSSVIDCDMGMPVIMKEDKLVRISFTEIPAYIAETASFIASASGEYSGDSFEIFDLNSSEKYVVLSDGMGTGKRARLDSVFTVSLVSKIISSGMSMQTAHRLINSMLRVKGWEESFATLDLLKLDLNGGCARVLKSGAPSGRLCRDGCVTSFGGQAFPAGIFAECIPDMTDIKLFDGDILLMFSDGVDEETADEISRFAADFNGNLEDMTMQMGRQALAERNSENPDDITLIAVRIAKNTEKCH